ncbi:MAG: diguanylate cyclase (GGDEF)-like protein/PAS domain S-box-containing protein [Sulfurimonas sp.]|jgi:diguanylate cyclase (GGDEF)-like protein/PAS domain S-box-containing protein|uniref:diguanylate cyclase n=1 Tax=Sulfurimonas sp. TaxID=2022749 RepID=UPI0039E6446B
MVDGLKQKTHYSYLFIFIVFTLMLLTTVFLIYSEKSTAHNINIAGKQRMISQRIALLCNNYYDNPSNERIKFQIEEQLITFNFNHDVITNIGNKKLDEILYSSRYQYDNSLHIYESNVLKFLSNKSLEKLKIINYTNESLLRTADTLVEVMENEFAYFINFFISLILILSTIFMATLYFVYKNITLSSILKMQEALNTVEKDEQFIKSIVDNSAHAIITTTSEGFITLFNKQAESLLGYKSEDIINKHTPALFHKEAEVVQRAEELSTEPNKIIKPGFDVFVEKTKRGLKNTDEWIYVDIKGKEIVVKLSITALKDKNGLLNGYMGIAEDMTEIKMKESDIKNYLHLIDENIITSTTDLSGKITFSSKAFNRINGYLKNELLGKNHRIVRHEDMSSDTYKELWEYISNDKVWHGEIKNKRKDGSFYWVYATIYPIYDNDKNKIGYTAIGQDITDKKTVEMLSITDALTNLYNRRYFNDVAQIELDRAKRDKNLFAFVLLDIDHFKKYNDMYGHQEGDNVLIDVSQSLKDSFQRSIDIVFRLGGEEFGAIVNAKNIKEIEYLVEQARANIEDLAIEHKLNVPSKVVTASFGVVILYADDFTKVRTIDDIYKAVDDLLYEAKETGRNKIVLKEI